MSSKIEKFGRNLGFGIKPWVQKYGVNWQMHLAKAIVSRSPEYQGMKVPYSREMYQRAYAFIQYNTKLHTGNSMIATYSKEGQRSFVQHGLTHHSLIQKAYDDTLRFQALYGRQKYISAANRKTIKEFKEIIKQAHTHKEKRELKSKLREFESQVTKKRWEVEAAKRGLKTRDPAFGTKELLDGSAYLKQHQLEKLKMQEAKLAATGENFWEKQFSGDPGEEIGKGNEIRDVTTDPKDWIRLGNYLKKARFIKLSVYKGIMNPKRRALRAFLRRYMGDKKYTEFFLSYNAPQKYATAAYFKPRSEYGTMKPSYDNKRLQFSPLQRMRSFTKSGKEILKKEK